MAREISVAALSAVGIGSVLVWSGLSGASVLAALQSILQGKAPVNDHARQIAIAGTAGVAGGAREGAAAAANPGGSGGSPDLPKPSGGGGGGKIQLPEVAAPPRLPPVPLTHISSPPPAKSTPWWDPLGWF